MDRLVLIDGNAILHRAYHALPVLTNRNGQQVNAVYGFASIMLRIIDELKPEYLAVAFDRPEPTFRKQEYIGYQAKRKEMETELASQVDLVHELVGAYGVEIFEKAGFEADDVIGSLARQAVSGKRPPEIETVIVTGDKDLMQLVNAKVKLYMPTRGMSEGEIVDEMGVKNRLGVLPSQVVDYKALVGDNSDNYPGVPGIGPKTALELITGLGSFGQIIKQVDKVKSETVRKKLTAGRESGELSYKLARIVTDVPVKLDIDKLKVDSLNEEGLMEFFRQMNFRSLAKRLGGGGGGGGVSRKKKQSITDENQQSLF